MSIDGALKHLSDRIDVLEQRNKRYLNSLEYLSKVAKQELQKDENNIETEILAMEIIKVYEDTINYTFEL